VAARSQIIPIFLPHWGCPYRCVYCNQTAISARVAASDVSGEIAEALTKIPPGVHPVEVAFYGGTFTALDLTLQQELLLAAAPFLSDGRVDSIRVSTHPACIAAEALDLISALGVKTVELGVQSMQADVLQQAGRAYGTQVVEDAVNTLRGKGFVVGIQLMPGLPGDSKTKTLATVQRVITLEPDFVRVYPTVVLANTALASLWQKGKYRALNLDEAVDWCAEISKLFAAAGIPIIRMGLHASPELEKQVLAGPYHPAFRALVDSYLALEKIEMQLRGVGDPLLICCNPRDIPVVRGDKNSNVAKLKEKYGFGEVEVCPDPALGRGVFRVTTK